tara:strand:- start:4737 stop:6494 length:1758 start_codon:yes stop_codon:yes gene_type:complete
MILQKTNITFKDIKADIYLGSWCTNSIEAISKKNIHKYHWSNLRKFENDSILILKYYEYFIKKITPILNSVNRENNDHKYWQRIVGPWLLYFISVVFERLENLKSLENKSNIKTYLPKYDFKEWIPLDFVDFEDMILRDEWNLYIYSEIVKISNIVNFKILDNNIVNKNIYKRKKDATLKKISKKFIYYFIKLLPEKLRNICLIETKLNLSDIFWINLRLRKFPFQYYIRENTKIKNININLRNECTTKNKLQIDNDEFCQLFASLIFNNIPIAYLESFNSNRKRAMRIYPKNPKFIFTSSAYFSNEMFKIWTAEKSKENKKIFVQVHGGHHATASFNHPGQFTEKIADKFFTWGWGTNILSSPKLSRLKVKINKYKSYRKKLKICLVIFSANKYSNSITSSPTSSNFLKSLKDYEKLFLNIKKTILKNLTIRIRKSSNGWDIEKYFRSLGVTNFSYLNKINYNFIDNFKKLVSKHSLFICTYDSTMFYELLTLNVPTLIYLDEKFWKLNKNSKKDFDKLSNVNIYFNSIEKLSNYLNKINQDEINKWWFSDDTQKIKDNFLQNYGRSNIDYSNEWINIIKKNIN